MKMADFCEANWSGKRDSNPRPLPPEDVAPAATWRFSVAAQRTTSAPGAACSRSVHGGGSHRTSNPCLAPASAGRPNFPYQQSNEEEFARCRRLLRASPEAKYTYFMRDRRNGLIKIGMSLDPHGRRARLSSSGFCDMEILATLRGGDLEKAYHQHFADLCVRGEWFHPHPDILAEIARINEVKP